MTAVAVGCSDLFGGIHDGYQGRRPPGIFSLPAPLQLHALESRLRSTPEQPKT
jgi:hypothetical protein